MKIAIFGSGGHGWSSLSNFVCERSENDSITFYYIPADWGGYTGFVGRVLEFKPSHIKTAYPWGDINKLIIYFLSKNISPSAKLVFEQRVSLFSEHGEKQLFSNLQTFCEILDLKAVEKEYLYLFLSNFLTKAKDCRGSLKYICEQGSISNIFNQYIYTKDNSQGSITDFNYFYNKNGILPLNISVDFIYKNRLVLNGITNKKQELTGEEVIDISIDPIIPETFYLTTVDGQKIESEDVGEFCNKLIMSDYIIIPNGSIANWLPLVNIIYIQKVLIKKSQEGKLFAIMNLFHTQNEYQFSYYLNYLNDLGISPLVIGPKLQHLILNKSSIKGYEEEGKTLNDLDNMEIENYIASLEIVTKEQNPDIEGVKYTPKSLTKILNLLIK
jgi:hypothetical protein